MRDLFLGCAYVRTYVAVTLKECQFEVMLRNVKLRSRLRNVNLWSCSGIRRH